MPFRGISAKRRSRARVSSAVAEVLEDRTMLSIDVALVALAAPTVVDDVDTLPTSLDSVYVGTTYVVEVWLTDSQGAGGGLSNAAIDVTYTTDLADVSSVEHGGVFAQSSTGSVDKPNGLIDEFGGGTAGAGVGLSPRFVRLGYFTITAAASGTAAYSASAASAGISRAVTGIVDASEIDFGSGLAIAHVSAELRYDLRLVSTPTTLNANGEIGVLPSSESEIHEWETFHLEVYVSTPVDVDLGVLAAGLDLEYANGYFTPTTVEYGAGFSSSRAVPTMDDDVGLITGIAADTGGVDSIADDAFALLARIRFEPLPSDNVPLDVTAAVPIDFGPFEVEFETLRPMGELELVGTTFGVVGGEGPETELFPVSFDLSDDGSVNFTDATKIVGVYRESVGEASSPYTLLSDFNGDGSVDFADFTAFVLHYGKRRGDDLGELPASYFEGLRRDYGEVDPPEVTLELTNDTGDEDGVTSEIGVTGSILGTGEIESLVLSIDGTAIDQAPSVLDDFDPVTGTFTLSPARLVELNGGAFDEGPISLLLRATDEFGNNGSATLDLVLDTTSPSIAAAPSGTLSVAPDSLDIEFDDAMGSAAFTTAAYTLTIVGGPSDGTEIALGTALSITDSTVQLALDSSLSDGDYLLTVVPTLVDLAGNVITGPLSFPFTVADPTGISSVSPANGEESVSVTRETIVRFDEAVDPATVNGDTFFAIANGERLPGRVVVSSTERFATLFYDDPLPASTEIRVTLDGSVIMGRDGMPLDADGDNVPGGTATVDFRTLPLTRIAGTNVFGYVRDSMTGDPLVGVTIRVDAFPEANAVTDASGRFELVDMPAPDFFVHIDGSTATHRNVNGTLVPIETATTTYPNVGKPFHSVPGQTIQLNHYGDVFDVFLPAVSLGDIRDLSDTETTEVGFGDAGKQDLESFLPDVDPAVFDLVGVTFEPGSAVDDEGNPATRAVIVPVPPDRIPAPLPANLNPELVISIQAAGATNFDIPAEVTFPNLEGLAPGEQSLIFSFDHDAGAWVVVGTGTVSPDGLTIVSNGGIIRAPGWHVAVSGNSRQQDSRNYNEDRETSDHSIDPLDEAAARAALVGAAAKMKAESLLFGGEGIGADHILHFIGGSGEKIVYPSTSGVAVQVLRDQHFATWERLMAQQVVNDLNAILSQGRFPSTDELSASLERRNFRPDFSHPDARFASPDLYWGIHGAQRMGVSATVQYDSASNSWTYSASYTIGDDYGFDSRDALSGGFLKQVANSSGYLLQREGDAHWFEVEVEVDTEHTLDGPLQTNSNPSTQASFATSHHSSGPTSLSGLATTREAFTEPPSSLMGFYFHIETVSGLQFRGETSIDGEFEINLPVNTTFKIGLYDPVSARYAIVVGGTGEAGVFDVSESAWQPVLLNEMGGAGLRLRHDPRRC